MNFRIAPSVLPGGWMPMFDPVDVKRGIHREDARSAKIGQSLAAIPDCERLQDDQLAASGKWCENIT
jgi:hypothetical protein